VVLAGGMIMSGLAACDSSRESVAAYWYLPRGPEPLGLRTLLDANGNGQARRIGHTYPHVFVPPLRPLGLSNRRGPETVVSDGEAGVLGPSLSLGPDSLATSRFPEHGS
jgi:hypothetical protein